MIPGCKEINCALYAEGVCPNENIIKRAIRTHGIADVQRAATVIVPIECAFHDEIMTNLQTMQESQNDSNPNKPSPIFGETPPTSPHDSYLTPFVPHK